MKRRTKATAKARPGKKATTKDKKGKGRGAAGKEEGKVTGG
jgi:hypothetical protein